MRECLDNDLTLYVRRNGNDSSNGLTSETAWLHPQVGWERMRDTYDPCGKQLTLSIIGNFDETASGVQAGEFALSPTGIIPGQGSNYPIITGDTNDAWAAQIHTISHSIVVRDALVRIKNLSVISQNGDGIQTEWPGTRAMLDNINFYGCFYANVHAIKGSYIFLNASQGIWGGAKFHLMADAAEIFDSGGDAGFWNINGTPSYEAFAYAYNNAMIGSHTKTRTGGTVTGPRCRAIANSTIACGGQGQAYWPGSSDGLIDASSQII